MKRMQRIAAACLAFAAACSMHLTAFAAVEDTGFSDVSASDWFAESVAYVRDHGVMQGTSETTFDPNGTTSRGQIAAILHRAAGSPAVSAGTSFPDVADTAYYADAAGWAAANGIAVGYDSGAFGPNDPITREQLAAMLWRYAGSPAAEPAAAFADEGAIAAYAAEAVDWVQANGVIAGEDGNRFNPAGRATRAQASAILHRYLELPDGQSPEQPDTPEPDGQVLVAYFSATGNTGAVAGQIADSLGADLFEITPAQPYTDADLDWTDEDSRVVYEYENPEARAVALETAAVDNWADYDTVFLGYPIWWGVAAWPVDSFVQANDFTGKTVIPFCTSSSSGIGDSGDLLEALTGTWLEGERFRSGASEADVQAWLDSLT